MNEEILKLLIRSLDEKLSEEDERKLSDALKNSEGFLLEKQRLLKLRNDISESAVNSFEPFFAEKVMNKIESAQKPGTSVNHIDRIFYYVFRRFAVIGAAAVLLFIVYNFILTGQISLSALFGIPEITYEEIIEPVFAIV